ncbi:MAG TPA: homoprotocatechuate degradation operon regulator HpaR [Ottowia sp.]|uniref:homoprotocatechuate degradation operon regulator HpaR n=1 Tax=Ottowia sp. TaxID=1898956 RepID=UPI002B81610D|nr:homoprotocatechuate degradation operon regulator HpaR [Ottowia sp.]MCZ2087903.1 homoprotocatechuate degradation operon regulator HpaR [Burkholderiales bacterium]HNE59866.1 homoprotocatechuate degradation operon regulator HpaR [Ottowia sp.]HNI85494.1 homoprotocatechuate degradation operon regulator HpaR [Ottowia sp.]HNK53947.1 homoprotocatechuate degradation operon regulator HpaR [Ottowia sp.]HNL42049.1 homoprotocatechuate degradation operon regulator HpaR [Ottowia sp.]
MPRPTPFVHRNLPLLLLRAREALMQHYRPGLRAHGLSDQQWRVLRVLREHEGGLETGRLAQQAYILGPSLTGMLARMEKSGLVARQRCPDDARRSLVAATPDGLALADALSDAIEAQYQDLAAHLGQARLNQLYTLLDELIALPSHADAEPVEALMEP